MNITERINVQHIKDSIATYGKADISDRGLCVVCHAIGSGSKNGLIFCSPEHQEAIFGED